MILKRKNPGSRSKRTLGFTLTETMVASGVGMLLMAGVVTTGIFSSRSFSSMGNYTELDEKSRYALDIISREVRNATAVTAFENSPPIRSITLSNSIDSTIVMFQWDSSTEKLELFKTGQTRKTLLTGCDKWTVAFYTRAPSVSTTNIIFNTATNLSDCKLIDMSWRCYRTIIGQKLNTESVQTAQVVLRNKIN